MSNLAKKDELITRVEYVTPELAKKYLEKNYGNRNLHLPTVKILSRKMKEGKWELNHQGIAFDKYGRLVDGQHRLHAIIMSGIGVWLQITEYAKPIETMDASFDIGKIRSVSDRTGLHQQIIAVVKIFFYMFGKDREIDPMHIKTIYEGFTKEVEKIQKITGLQLLRTSVRQSASNPLIVLWNAPMKSALLMLLFSKVNINAIKDLLAAEQQYEYMCELYDTLVDTTKGNQREIMDRTVMIYHAIKYKYVLADNDWDLRDSTRSEMRKALMIKYPEIFG